MQCLPQDAYQWVTTDSSLSKSPDITTKSDLSLETLSFQNELDTGKGSHMWHVTKQKIYLHCKEHIGTIIGISNADSHHDSDNAIDY